MIVIIEIVLDFLQVNGSSVATKSKLKTSIFHQKLSKNGLFKEHMSISSQLQNPSSLV